MNSLVRISIIASMLNCTVAHSEDGTSPTESPRQYVVTYTTEIQNLPEGAQAVDLWFPVPVDTDGQKVTGVEVVHPQGGAMATEPEYGNTMYHYRFEAPFARHLVDGKLGAELKFEIHRTEIVVAEAKNLTPIQRVSLKTDFNAYLQENRLIPTDGPIDALAAELQLEGLPPIHAAKRIYDYLIDTFTYDWQIEGGGEGDVRWACDAKSGDCSDYHSVFLALCRNQGIPADHEFGFPIRTKRPEGRIPSYHCWARFYVEGIGWIPIDASEADKHPELRDYNFGSQSVKLLKFTHGRDVMLEPPQQGPPLNRYVYPYFEVDGKPHDDYRWAVRFKDTTAAE